MVIPERVRTHRMILEHLSEMRGLRKNLESLSKEEFKQLLEDVERRYPHEVAREITVRKNLSDIEYSKIKSTHKTMRMVLRNPGSVFLAKLILLQEKKKITSEEARKFAKETLKDRLRQSGVGMSILVATGAVEGMHELRVKNPEHVEALLEYYVERGILPRKYLKGGEKGR